MVTFVHELGQVSVPDWVNDLNSFRRWTDADKFPEKGNIWFLKGRVWVDMSREEIFTHELVKTRFTVILAGVITPTKRGLLLGDGAFLSNVEAGLSRKPDVTFVSNESLNECLVRSSMA